LKPKPNWQTIAIFTLLNFSFQLYSKSIESHYFSFVFIILGYLILAGTMPNIVSSFEAIQVSFSFSFSFFFASLLILITSFFSSLYEFNSPVIFLFLWHFEGYLFNLQLFFLEVLCGRGFPFNHLIA